MTDTYPALPGPRLALDQDGSVLLVTVNAGAPSDQSSHLAELMGVGSNVYSIGQSASYTYYFTVLFPSPLHLAGFWATCVGNVYRTSGGIATSTDTTDGTDGTWTGYAGGGTDTGSWNPNFRSAVAPFDLAGITGLRFWYLSRNSGSASYLQTLHLYGSYAASGDRLAFYNPGNGLPCDGNYLNFGDIPHGKTSDVRSMMVRNLSTTKTATGVQVARTPLPGSPMGVPGDASTGLLLSLDGSTWYGSIGLSDLPPGADSQTFYAKAVIDASKTVAPVASELSATCAGMA